MSTATGSNSFTLSLLKEVLYLNKIYIGVATIWAFIVAYIAANKHIETDCNTLYSFTIFGIVLGSIGSLFDFIWEVWQDSVYFFCSDDSAMRKAFGVPAYQGFTYIYFSKEEDAQISCTKDDNSGTCCVEGFTSIRFCFFLVFLIEALFIRFPGNVVLFLDVLGSVS